MPLHRRAKHPGREFGAAEIKTLALGWRSRSGPQHRGWLPSDRAVQLALQAVRQRYDPTGR